MREGSLETEERPGSLRFNRIKQELLSTKVCLCPERAYLVTDFFKRHDDPEKPVAVRKAEALNTYWRTNRCIYIRTSSLWGIWGVAGSQL
jgi:hypothetical protein